MKITQAGVVEPLFALCLADLELEEANTIIVDFCKAENIQVQTATVLALLDLSKKKKYAAKFIKMELYCTLLDMTYLLEEKIVSITCSVLGRMALISDEVKLKFMEEDICHHLLRRIRETNNQSLQCEVVSLFGCSLMITNESEEKTKFLEWMNSESSIELWVELFQSSYSPLRYRIVNILRLLLRDESMVSKISPVLTLEIIQDVQETENDPKILKDITSLLKALSIRKYPGSPQPEPSHFIALPPKSSQDKNLLAQSRKSLLSPPPIVKKE